MLSTVHHDSKSSDLPSSVDLSALTPLMRTLRLPFVTVDLALRDDGTWRVIELGDGQVSDRPRTTSAEELLRAVMPD